VAAGEPVLEKGTGTYPRSIADEQKREAIVVSASLDHDPQPAESPTLWPVVRCSLQIVEFVEKRHRV
jgi:hypothetical protein